MDIQDLNKTLGDIENALLRKGVDQIRDIVATAAEVEDIDTDDDDDYDDYDDEYDLAENVGVEVRKIRVAYDSKECFRKGLDDILRKRHKKVEAAQFISKSLGVSLMAADEWLTEHLR